MSPAVLNAAGGPPKYVGVRRNLPRSVFPTRDQHPQLDGSGPQHGSCQVTTPICAQLESYPQIPDTPTIGVLTRVDLKRAVAPGGWAGVCLLSAKSRFYSKSPQARRTLASRSVRAV